MPLLAADFDSCWLRQEILQWVGALMSIEQDPSSGTMKPGRLKLPLRDIEAKIEQSMVDVRWVLFAFYAGLFVVVGSLAIVFVGETGLFIYEIMHSVFYERKLPHLIILSVLSLIDIVLAANLVWIVIFAGYENFISRIEAVPEDDRPKWMGNITFAGLKLKLFSSIVAISGIQLLQGFMRIGSPGELSSVSLAWLTGIHLTFVASTVLFAFTSGHEHESTGGAGRTAEIGQADNDDKPVLPTGGTAATSS